MDRFPFLASVLIVVTLPGLLTANVHAGELYKWTDASGKVHYGDRAAAPESSVQVTVPVAPGRQRPRSDAQIKPSPTDRISMSVECTSLIANIENTPGGANWKQLSRQFTETCPGIAYECQADRATAQNHRCGWIDKSGSTGQNRKPLAGKRNAVSM